MQSKFESIIKNKIVVGIIAVICCALWGSAFPVIKIGYSILSIDAGDYNSQILFAGIRFTLAGIFTIIIGSILSKGLITIKRKNSYKVCILALFQTILQYLFFYIGLARTTATKSSILDSTSVFFSVIIAGIILKQEKINGRKIIGCVLGFLGVVLVNLSNGSIDANISLTGEGFIVLSALSYAISSVLIKSFSQNENPVALSGYQFVLGGAVMIVYGLVSGARIELCSTKAFLIIAYLASLSAVAYTLWGVLLKYNEVSRVTVFGFMTPVFGCVLSSLLLGESLSESRGYTLSALLLVCLGIFIVNKNKSIKTDISD